MAKTEQLGAREVVGDKALETFERGMGLRPSDRNETIGEGEAKFLLKPMPGRVAIRLKDIEHETKGGLILVGDSHVPKPFVGTVVAVCEEYEFENEDYDPLFRVDDIVVFGKYTGTRIQVGRDVYIILPEKEILCKLIKSDKPEAVSADEVKVKTHAID